MAYDPIIYGGSKSSVKGYAASRSKYFDELEKERKKKEKDTIAFGGSDPNSKAAKVEQSKGFWSGVGDFATGVGTTVVERVKGTGDFAVEAAKGIGNLIDTDAKMKKEAEYQKNKNEYLKQFLGDEKKYLE